MGLEFTQAPAPHERTPPIGTALPRRTAGRGSAESLSWSTERRP